MKFLAEMLWRDLYIRSPENNRHMLDHIYPYLLVHKKLQLAGIGTLEMVPVSAAIDKSGLRIAAPYEKINFILPHHIKLKVIWAGNAQSG